MWYVEADNGLGSLSGDVDDGFALSALILGRVPIAAVGSVYGNVPEVEAYANNRAMAALCGFQGAFVRGAARPGDDAAALRRFLCGREVRKILALGPLTGVASALADIPATEVEVTVVGGNTRSRGKFPPYWPFEFNLTKDRAAAARVLSSGARITILPLDVAKRLMMNPARLARLRGPVGETLRDGSRRWLDRYRRRLLRARAPVWDLAAAMAVVRPELFGVAEMPIRYRPNGLVEFGRGPFEARVIQEFDPDAVWAAFETLLESAPEG